MDWQAIELSLRLAVITTLVLLLAGTPLAYWLTYSPRRWKFLVEAVVALPLVLPPTVLGFYVLLAISPNSPVGAFYLKLTGGGLLPFSFQGLVAASVLYSLPFTVQPIAAAFVGVDRKLVEASWCLGVSRRTTFRRVIVPLAAPGIATSMSASLKTTLGDLPPSSSETRFRLPSAAWTIILPTSVEPVKAILSTSMWAARAAPAVSP